MGVSTDGQISYGIKFDEDYEFPWDGEEWDDGIESWWLKESGWRWDGEEPFTDEGDYAPGFSRDDPRIDAYFESRRSWKKSHPCPVELVNYQSGDCPAYLLCVPGKTIIASRGYPTELDAAMLMVTYEETYALLDFCRKYGLEGESGARWWLSSYWG